MSLAPASRDTLRKVVTDWRATSHDTSPRPGERRDVQREQLVKVTAFEIDGDRWSYTVTPCVKQAGFEVRELGGSHDAYNYAEWTNTSSSARGINYTDAATGVLPCPAGQVLPAQLYYVDGVPEYWFTWFNDFNVACQQEEPE